VRIPTPKCGGQRRSSQASDRSLLDPVVALLSRPLWLGVLGAVVLVSLLLLNVLLLARARRPQTDPAAVAQSHSNQAAVKDTQAAPKIPAPPPREAPGVEPKQQPRPDAPPKAAPDPRELRRQQEERDRARADKKRREEESLRRFLEKRKAAEDAQRAVEDAQRAAAAEARRKAEKAEEETDVDGLVLPHT
jgi:type IV secretory pathway VirB10-like protein